MREDRARTEQWEAEKASTARGESDPPLVVSRVPSVWHVLAINVMGVGLAIALMFGYVSRVSDRDERRNIERAHQICGLIEIIDDITQRQPEPTGPDADGVRRYRIELHRYRLTSCG